MIDLHANEVRFGLVAIGISVALLYPIRRLDFGRVTKLQMLSTIFGILFFLCITPLLLGLYVTSENLSASDALLLKGNSILIGTAYAQAFFVLRLVFLAIRQRKGSSGINT